MIQSRSPRAIPFAWALVAAALVLMAGLEFYAVVARPGIPEERKRFDRMREQFEKEYVAAATESQKRDVLMRADRAFAAAEWKSKGVEGSAGRVRAIIHGELGLMGPPSGPSPNAEADEFETEAARVEASKKREKLNEAIYRIYRESEISKDDAAELRSVILSTAGKRWPYDLLLKRLDRAAGAKPLDKQPLAGFVLLVVLVTGIAAWIWYAGASLSGMRPKGLPPENQFEEVSDNLAIRFLLYLAAFACLPGLGAAAISSVAFPYARELAVLGVMLASTYVIVSADLGGIKMSLARLGIKADNFWRHVAWGVGGFFANIPVLACLLFVTNKVLDLLPSGEHPLEQEIFTEFGFGRALIGAVIMAPIVEEIFFRGCLYQGVAARMKSWVWPIVITSVAFASLHPQGMQAWLVLGWIGAMAALLFRQTGSLIPAIVMHALNNFMAITLTILIL